MSLIRDSRSEPEAWMLRANSTCFAVRLPSGLSASISVRISRLFSGVRSSCDMLARNCDLYREASVSCSAFSCRDPRARSISRFLASTSAFCLASSSAFSSSSSLVCWSCSLCFFSSSSDSRSEPAWFSSRSLDSRSSSC